jgi:hypothetical protein
MPDVLATFAVWVYHDKVIIRAREHRERRWLEQWEVPCSRIEYCEGKEGIT